MSTLTIYLARLIGLSAVLLVAALLVRGNALIMATVADGPVVLVYAIVSLAAESQSTISRAARRGASPSSPSLPLL